MKKPGQREKKRKVLTSIRTTETIITGFTRTLYKQNKKSDIKETTSLTYLR